MRFSQLASQDEFWITEKELVLLNVNSESLEMEGKKLHSEQISSLKDTTLKFMRKLGSYYVSYGNSDLFLKRNSLSWETLCTLITPCALAGRFMRYVKPQVSLISNSWGVKIDKPSLVVVVYTSCGGDPEPCSCMCSSPASTFPRPSSLCVWVPSLPTPFWSVSPFDEFCYILPAA